jgi:hypothetical protein
MTADTEAARVAGMLSERQRDVILGDPDRLEGHIADLLNLCLRELATCRPDNTVFLTPLGLRVRQHLQEQTDAHR